MGSVPAWRHRDLLSLADLSAADMNRIFDLAKHYLPLVTSRGERSSHLAGCSVVSLFFEDSTRTRLSFARAAQLLSADVFELTGKGSSTSKGETIFDTAMNVEAMGIDALVVRHNMSGATKLIADHVSCSVVNAGDGRHEHPTQGLLDIFTIRQHFGPDLAGKHIVIVGDIVNSRVARSNIYGLTTLGANVTVVGPPTLVPADLECLGVTVSHDLDSIVSEVDAIMMLRVQFERLAGQAFPSAPEYRRRFALTRERAHRMPDHAVVMHPGPMNRGLEIDSEVASHTRSVILRQVTHGVAIRMAVLRLLVQANERGMA
ncbi:MAG: aspartate carbamoyltransferase catalytic subunit [Planctomycetes bacterium]|nr:aspartate carbamoyltransferase catalytic subunit [Planctomycetota bacterium]